MGQNQRRPSGVYSAAGKAILAGAAKCKKKGHRGVSTRRVILAGTYCTRCRMFA